MLLQDEFGIMGLQEIQYTAPRRRAYLDFVKSSGRLDIWNQVINRSFLMIKLDFYQLY